MTAGSLAKVMRVHTFANKQKHKSRFFTDVDLLQLIKEAEKTPAARQSGDALGRLERVVTAPDLIGIDRKKGPTRIYTVVTEADGSLVTMFPGLPPAKKF